MTTIVSVLVFLQVPSLQKKQRNQTKGFSLGLSCLVVLFLLLKVFESIVICASVPIEATVYLDPLYLPNVGHFP